MGRNSSGVNNYAKATGSNVVAVNASGRKLTAKQMKKITDSAKSLDTLPHREVVKQLNRALSRYEAVMGVRERTVMVADTGDSYGVTFLNGNGSQGIYLNRKFFSQHRNDIEGQYRKLNYSTGFKNVTNRPIQHTLTHELAHATWTSSYGSRNHKAAGVEIKALFKRWKADTKKKGYGRYGKQNVDEFWAEVITKGIHGKSDKYTKRAINIARKYKL